MAHMATRASLCFKFFVAGTDKTVSNKYSNFSNSRNSNNSKQSLMVWISLLKGLSCIISRKSLLNRSIPSFRPIRVEREATLCLTMFRVISVNSTTASSKLMFIKIDSFSSNSDFSLRSLDNSSYSFDSFSLMPFLKITILMMKNI